MLNLYKNYQIIQYSVGITETHMNPNFLRSINDSRTESVNQQRGQEKILLEIKCSPLLLQWGEIMSVELQPLTGPLFIPQVIYE
jgi:hypothetical protein